MRDIVTEEFKNLKDLDELKSKIRDYEPKNAIASFVGFIYTLGILIEQFYAWIVDNLHIVCKLCMKMLN